LSDPILITDETLIQIAGGLAALYGLGAFIGYARNMPISLILPIAAQALLLGTIIATYLNNFAANVTFLLAILTTIANVVVLGYEVRKIPSSEQKMLGVIDEALPS
jgi:hypothetical protein